MKLNRKQIIIVLLNIMFPLVVAFVSGRFVPQSGKLQQTLDLSFYNQPYHTSFIEDV